MKANRKNAFIIILIIGVIFVAVGAYLFFVVTKGKKCQIILNNWNGLQNRYTVGSCSVTDEDPYMELTYCQNFFSTKEDLEDLFKDNEDYIGTYTFYDEMLVKEAKVFYNDNNYYVLRNNRDDEYIISSSYSWYQMFGTIIYVPTPFYFSFEPECVDAYENEYEPNLVMDVVFNKISFSDMKEFYSRMDEKYYHIDETNQTITVDGYDCEHSQNVEDCMMFDYKNHTISGIDEDGKMQIFIQ